VEFCVDEDSSCALMKEGLLRVYPLRGVIDVDGAVMLHLTFAAEAAPLVALDKVRVLCDRGGVSERVVCCLLCVVCCLLCVRSEGRPPACSSLAHPSLVPPPPRPLSLSSASCCAKPTRPRAARSGGPRTPSWSDCRRPGGSPAQSTRAWYALYSSCPAVLCRSYLRLTSPIT
jgi:hypothetical protein